jgi:hypothetical protein
MASIIALDLGTANSAFAAYVPGQPRPTWGHVSFSRFASLPGNADGAVMDALHDWLLALINRYRPVAHMGAELPWVPQARTVRVGPGALSSAKAAMPMNAQTVRRLSGMYMHAAWTASRLGIEWRGPDTWEVERHWLGKSGHRSAEKKRLTKQMCEAQGLKPVSIDEADGLALLSFMMTALLPPALHRQGPLFEAARERATCKP